MFIFQNIVKLTFVPCVPTEAVTVFGAVEVLVVIVEVSCDLGGRDGGCVSVCRAAAVRKVLKNIIIVCQPTNIFCY